MERCARGTRSEVRTGGARGAVGWLLGAIVLSGCAGQARTYTDPFSYCGAVGTIDTPDQRYAGAAVPPAIAAAFATPARIEGLQPASNAAGTYTIEVALFETQQGAAWLAADLTAVGFRAYGEVLDLPNRGIQHLVSIGPYATRTRADFDLQRLHLARGYEHARLRGN